MNEHIDHHRMSVIPETPLHLEIRDALQETVDRAAQAGVDLYLAGGISACILSGDAWPDAERPLSRDLDFLISHDDETLRRISETFGGSFVLNEGKPVFKSLKLMTHASNGVELDFIARSRVVHPDAQLEVGITPVVTSSSMSGEFLGALVKTLPPALVCLQKLFAGRGLDLGKYDLLDARSIICAELFSPNDFLNVLREMVPADSRKAVCLKLRNALGRMETDDRISALSEALSDAVSAEGISTISAPVQDALSKLDA